MIVGVNGRSLHKLPPNTAVALIKGPPGTDVKLTVKPPRTAPARTLTVTRATISEPVVASEMRTVHGVKLGWVYLATFSEGSARRALRRRARPAQAGRPRPRLRPARRRWRAGLRSAPDRLASSSPPGDRDHARALPADHRFDRRRRCHPRAVPVVVLVDHDTASASEIVTAALQDHHRATVVGTHTYGKGVFQELEPLSAGGAIKITVGEYYTPNGRNLGGRGVNEGAGVAPEVLVAHGVDTEHGLQVALHTLLLKVR